jgi:ornithine carbamoyltransferase
MAKHFIRIHDHTRDEIIALLELARELKAEVKRGQYRKQFAGKTLGLIFEKASTRTRVSFEVGFHQLGGHSLFLSPRDSQMGRGEPVEDSARVLGRMLDGIVLRTFSEKLVLDFAQWSGVPVINGLTDDSHPCQIMADLLTVKEKFGRIDGLTYAWVGDGNNMSNSWIEAAGVLGFTLRLACPEGYDPDARLVREANDRGGKVTVTRDAAEACRGAHVINTDVFTSMGQEAETEVRLKVFAPYQVNAETTRYADSDWMFLHCLPAHRGEEVTGEIIEGVHSAVFDQAENRLHAQKAILVSLLS